MITIGATAGFSTISRSTSSVAANGDLVLADAGNGPITITLPATGPTNMQVSVKKIDASANAVTVVGSGSATIDGDSSCVLVTSGSGAVFAYDGVNWRVLSTAVINSGTDSLQSLWVPNIVPGTWYDRRTFTGLNYPMTTQVPGTAGFSSFAPSSVTYIPFYAHRAMVIDNVAISTGTTTPTAGSAVRIGLYTALTSGLPGTRIFEAGPVSPTASGTNYTAVMTGTIPKGWSWWALSLNATSVGSLYGVSTQNTPTPVQGFTTMPALVASVQQLSNGTFFYYEAGTGTLPAVATPLAVQVAQASILAPNIYYRVAS